MKRIFLFLLIATNLISGNDIFYKVIGRSTFYGCPNYNYHFHFKELGDFNGDGYKDIMGKSEVFNAYISSVWIIYGGAGRFPEEVSICDYSGRVTYIYGLGNWDYLVGVQVGDFNGDGYDDIVIGNWWTTIQSNYPDVYIIYGSPNLPEVIEIGNFPQNLKVTRIKAGKYYSYLGQYMSAEDMNGDGYDDLILDKSIYKGDYYEWSIYIIYGSPIGIPDMNIEFPPENTNSISGISFALPEDINNDGKLDLITSYLWDGFDGDRQNANLVLILYNNQSGFPEEVDIKNPPENSTIIYGAKKNDDTGGNIFFKDIDFDGYKDLIISADRADSADSQKKYVGKIWILYGTPSGFPKTIDLLYPPEASTVIYGAEEYDAYGEVVEIGDINNDGYLDIISSNPSWDESNKGKIWILYGNGKRFPKIVDLSNPPECLFSIEGKEEGDMIGISLKIYDLDKDGLNDFIFNSCAYKSNTGYADYCEFNIFYYSVFKLKMK